MLLLGFLFVAFFILNASQLTFLPLGHTGSAYAKAIGAHVQLADVLPLEGGKDVDEVAIKKWDIENNITVDTVDKSESKEDLTGESKNPDSHVV
jgi:hypothetical protein